MNDGTQTDESRLSIRAIKAFVASANARCWKCHVDIAVICVYVRQGTVDGDPQSDFTVSNITALNDALKRHLAPLPFFRPAESRAAEMTYWANHCFECNALQGDFYLHSEPGGAFFPASAADFSQIQFSPLPGDVLLEGDIGMGPMQDAFEAVYKPGAL